MAGRVKYLYRTSSFHLEIVYISCIHIPSRQEGAKRERVEKTFIHSSEETFINSPRGNSDEYEDGSAWHKNLENLLLSSLPPPKNTRKTICRLSLLLFRFCLCVSDIRYCENIFLKTPSWIHLTYTHLWNTHIDVKAGVKCVRDLAKSRTRIYRREKLSGVSRNVEKNVFCV